ncbi:pyrroloquinoline quinone biosynthesis protein PqqB [Robbsia sp. Bb-Pol-6]|uniref:Coenzyme PQQ synthesis protein B n=1 Tax=Robbsia betulipollinis TaxID=2981849 RepID=A0ABT3ZMK9_9BURK|nr:pyrroloquinoline quinone biosynthesis protein PqqB [Robbsia betulipollinis]MCY0387778.1 pyrroloquinoline quinone biosynthesis protein PqqB [Robbsia betulipollinis]
MRLRVLGSAAGGGFPQWNCNCRNCAGVRQGTVNARTRTQSSIAVSTNGNDWLLINASPDILSQIAAFPALQPARQTRDTGIAAVLLMDSQIDHVTGLLMLRENAGPLHVHSTEPVWNDLNSGFPIGRMFEHYCGMMHSPLPIDGSKIAPAPLVEVDITAVPLSSKAPPYSPHREAPVPGDNIGLLMENRATGKSAFYAPGLGHADARVIEIMHGADLLLVDGTFWTQTEMIDLGFSKKTALDMGHLAQSGKGGMIDLLDALPRRDSRKVLIHINNTNPILIEDGAQRRMLQTHGIEVAHDGMEFQL